MKFRLGSAGIVIALLTQPQLLPQTKSRTTVSVPFVGCVSYGQVKVSAAPQGSSKLVAIKSDDAQELAYYESADGIGLLGPRGWFCEGASGSGGPALYLSPKSFQRGPGWKGFDEFAIEVDHTNSENSGRL